MILFQLWDGNTRLLASSTCVVHTELPFTIIKKRLWKFILRFIPSTSTSVSSKDAFCGLQKLENTGTIVWKNSQILFVTHPGRQICVQISFSEENRKMRQTTINVFPFLTSAVLSFFCPLTMWMHTYIVYAQYCSQIYHFTEPNFNNKFHNE